MSQARPDYITAFKTAIDNIDQVVTIYSALSNAKRANTHVSTLSLPSKTYTVIYDGNYSASLEEGASGMYDHFRVRITDPSIIFRLRISPNLEHYNTDGDEAKKSFQNAMKWRINTTTDGHSYAPLGGYRRSRKQRKNKRQSKKTKAPKSLSRRRR